MANQQGVLTVYQAGELTVVGFGGQDALSRINLAECRDELITLIRENHCQTLAFDLTGVSLIPSGTLGLMASMRNLGVEVHVYNPSNDIRDVLDVTKLNTVIHIHEIEIPESGHK